MKKILFILLLLYPVILLAQPANGDGSSGNPYSGLITTPWTLSGDKYCGELSVTSGTFTISAGSTLRFGTGNSLTISGTAILSASGNSSNFITFTASGTSWGHLNFTSTPSSNSVLDYCIIEKGNATGLSPNYGGAILAQTSKLSVSNCLIRNNSAGWGGGIFINTNFNPSISRCHIYSNTATSGGGGIYIYYFFSSVISNCIIDYNTCSGSTYGGGGVFIGPSVGTANLANCVVVNNTNTNNGKGDNIYFYGSNNIKIINTIIWSSENSVFFRDSYSSTNFINSAIQRVYNSSGTIPVSSFTACLDLGTSNTDPVDGPNFKVTDGTDWSIEFYSPCRDAGTTPSPAVPNDYLGNSRIGAYDIGAYEVQYSRWTGAVSTSWATAGNWDKSVAPDLGTGDVIIPSGLTNYPTGSSTQDYTIGSNKTMVINPAAKATFGTLNNNGTFKLKSDASGEASLIVTTYSGNNAIIELFLTGGGDKTTYKWHYISTPVSSLPVSTFAPGTTLDFAQFVESLPTFSTREGWVAYDGYIYSTGQMGGPTFSDLTPGKGYDYWDNANNTFMFTGQLNTGDIAMSLGFSGDASLHGLNLLGNPFSSGLNWDDIIDSVYYSYPTNTSRSLYFTRDNVQCSYVSGVGTPLDVTGIIPPMQGFFTKTYATGKTITLPAAARIHDNIHARYKGSTIIPLVRLKLNDNSTSTDETVVRFAEKASPDFDNYYDALKMFLSSDVTTIYSTSDGVNYSINGQPFPETFIEIPIVVNLIFDTIHKISAIQLQGLEGYDVTLIDNTTGFTANLKTTPDLTFTSSKGLVAGRFVLKITNILTGVETPAGSKSIFNIYQSQDIINIQTVSDDWDSKSGSVKVLDIAGKTVSDLQNTGFSKTSVTQVQAPAAKGLYFIEIMSGMKRFVGKVVIK